jgi:hypothetical protein
MGREENEKKKTKKEQESAQFVWSIFADGNGIHLDYCIYGRLSFPLFFLAASVCFVRGGV